MNKKKKFSESIANSKTAQLRKSALIFSVIGIPLIIFFAMNDESAVGITATLKWRILGVAPMVLFLIFHFAFSAAGSIPSYQLFQWLGAGLGLGVAGMDAALLYTVLVGTFSVDAIGLAGTVAGNFLGLFAVSILRGVSPFRMASAVAAPYIIMVLNLVVNFNISANQWVFIGNVLAAVLCLIIIVWQRERGDTERLIAVQELNEERYNLKKIVEERTAELEILLKELHHRVRNNLQTIIGVINLYENCLAGDFRVRQLTILRHAVQMIGIIHSLTNNDQVHEKISVRKFFENVCCDSNWSHEKINVECEIEDAMIYAELAITIGLICVHQIMQAKNYCNIKLRHNDHDVVLTLRHDIAENSYRENSEILRTLADIINARIEQKEIESMLVTEITANGVFRYQQEF